MNIPTLIVTFISSLLIDIFAFEMSKPLYTYIKLNKVYLITGGIFIIFYKFNHVFYGNNFSLTVFLEFILWFYFFLFFNNILIVKIKIYKHLKEKFKKEEMKDEQ